MQKKTKGIKGAKAKKRRCANCFACRKDTPLCLLSEHYDPEGVYKILEEKYQQKK